MQYCIANTNYRATVDLHGAELKSLTNVATATEFVWSGDSAIWSGTAPILFPVVGRLKKSRFLFNNQLYEMPKHGFARASQFSLIRHTTTTLELLLESSKSSKINYPFDFEFVVAFELSEGKLKVIYRVKNSGSEDMYFCLGSHPAFSLSDKLQQIEDYSLQFSEAETLDRYYIENDLISVSPQLKFLDGENTIRISETIFDDDALIFKNIKSRYIDLYCKDKRLLSVDTGGAPHLGIWAKPAAPFVCIEPWFGVDDDLNANEDITMKPNFNRLPGHEIFEAYYAIEIF